MRILELMQKFERDFLIGIRDLSKAIDKLQFILFRLNQIPQHYYVIAKKTLYEPQEDRNEDHDDHRHDEEIHGDNARLACTRLAPARPQGEGHRFGAQEQHACLCQRQARRLH